VGETAHTGEYQWLFMGTGNYIMVCHEIIVP
jgi:hypothetical protein